MITTALFIVLVGLFLGIIATEAAEQARKTKAEKNKRGKDGSKR